MSTWIACRDCNRGFRGNDKHKCSCGWSESTPASLGCHIGTAIVGVPQKPKKLTRAQQKYRQWLKISDVCDTSFIDFLKQESARISESKAGAQ